MRFTMPNNQFHTPYHIGVGDLVSFNGRVYHVLINYIKGQIDAKGYIPASNRTILINNDNERIMCHNYKELRLIDA